MVKINNIFWNQHSSLLLAHREGRLGTVLNSQQVEKILKMLTNQSISYINSGKEDTALDLDYYDAVLEIQADGGWNLKTLKRVLIPENVIYFFTMKSMKDLKICTGFPANHFIRQITKFSSLHYLHVLHGNKNKLQTLYCISTP